MIQKGKPPPPPRRSKTKKEKKEKAKLTNSSIERRKKKRILRFSYLIYLYCTTCIRAIEAIKRLTQTHTDSGTIGRRQSTAPHRTAPANALQMTWASKVARILYTPNTHTYTRIRSKLRGILVYMLYCTTSHSVFGIVFVYVPCMHGRIHR